MWAPARPRGGSPAPYCCATLPHCWMRSCSKPTAPGRGVFGACTGRATAHQHTPSTGPHACAEEPCGRGSAGSNPFLNVIIYIPSSCSVPTRQAQESWPPFAALG
ncbi:unnamed protein product, partial [Heterosigma akashiwo]